MNDNDDGQAAAIRGLETGDRSGDAWARTYLQLRYGATPTTEQASDLAQWFNGAIRQGARQGFKAASADAASDAGVDDDGGWEADRRSRLEALDKAIVVLTKSGGRTPSTNDILTIAKYIQNGSV